jgi:hypothetical protein
MTPEYVPPLGLRHESVTEFDVDDAMASVTVGVRISDWLAEAAGNTKVPRTATKAVTTPKQSTTDFSVTLR